MLPPPPRKLSLKTLQVLCFEPPKAFGTALVLMTCILIGMILILVMMHSERKLRKDALWILQHRPDSIIQVHGHPDHFERTVEVDDSGNIRYWQNSRMQAELKAESDDPTILWAFPFALIVPIAVMIGSYPKVRRKYLCYRYGQIITGRILSITKPKIVWNQPMKNDPELSYTSDRPEWHVVEYSYLSDSGETLIAKSGTNNPAIFEIKKPGDQMTLLRIKDPDEFTCIYDDEIGHMNGWDYSPV